MTGKNPTRRRFLASTALGSLGLVGSAGVARAFTSQKMTADAHRAYVNACTGAADPYHRQLAEDAAAELGGSLSPAELNAAIAAMRCPICGCSLVDFSAAKVE
ncbi:MAG TPA: hypothetical protein VM689_03415 [Aliidongia sp.]|nr:hypothetical protein [Aliidongia sp.]